MDQGVAIVIDIGKTNAKVSLWSRDGRCLAREVRANAPSEMSPDGYLTLDTPATMDWLQRVLGGFAGQPVEAIVPVAHGGAVVGVSKGCFAFDPPDYEWAMPEADLAVYRAGRDPFARTGSPALPAGLNLGAQLHYLEAQGSLKRARLMPYAQFWAWLLTGVARSEVTSLGCHTDLWDPAAGDFSAMAKRRGWATRFARLAHASEAVGRLRLEMADETGLPRSARVFAGLHDSNAALHAARGFPEIGGHEATVLSTGTWFVAMRTPGGPVDLAALPEARDCLVNVDVEGRPVPSARWMGGRELELLGKGIKPATKAALDAVLRARAMVLPSMVAGTGPMPHHTGRWRDRPEDPAGRAAAISLYAALMVDTMLHIVGAKERLLIEGRFAASEVFVRALAALRPDMRIWTAEGEADVSFGALRLVLPDLAPPGALVPVEPLAGDIIGYREHWRGEVARDAASGENRA